MKPGLSNFLFWQKWLFYTSLIFAIAGLVMTFPNPNPFLEGYKYLLAHNLFSGKGLSDEADQTIQFIRGPYGSTICCAYILLAYVAAVPFKKREKWSRDAIVAAFGLWFVIDSVYCILNEMYFQVLVFNTISLLQKALPILFTWQDFKEKPGTIKIAGSL